MFPHKGAFSSVTSSSNVAQSAVPIITDNNQWISQSAYQNVDTSTVDWAAVAQQWIHMKESFGPSHNEEHFPIAPPPPRISQPIDFSEEQGEAPMEVEHDDEPLSRDNSMPLTVPSPPKNAFSSHNLSNNGESSNRQKSNQKQWNNKRGNRWSSTNQSKNHRNDNNYVTGQVFNSKPENNSCQLEIVSSAKSSDSKFQAMDTNTKSGITQVEQVGLSALPSLDAAQRKTLPAWIREGLEKMDREKMKQADRDREMKERDEKRRQEKLLEQSLLMQFNTNDSAPTIPAKSKFDSESDSDNDETVNSDYNESVSKNAKTATFVSATTGSIASGSSSETTATAIRPHRPKADILTEIMLSVRKILTEILLEVTNEEIHTIAHETLSKLRTKGRKAQTVQKNALTAKTSLLGLVTYDDSDGSHSDDDSSDDYDKSRQKNNSDDDSESELKITILRRKQSFENKSAEIENYLAKTEERERLWLEKDDENVKTSETNNSIELATASTYNLQSKINDSVPLLLQNDATKTQTNASKIERKGSRFSDAKGLIYNVASSQTIFNAPVANQYIRSNCVDEKGSSTIELKRSDSKRDRSDSDSDSSRKRSSKSSRHHSKRYSSRSPSKRKHKHKRRSSSSSSDRSNYSKQSKSSHSSHKYDRYSKEKHRSHKSSRRSSRSRSHSSDRHSKRRHR